MDVIAVGIFQLMIVIRYSFGSVVSAGYLILSLFIHCSKDDEPYQKIITGL